MNAPCYECKEREPGCHGKCAAYAEYKEKTDAAAEKRRYDAEMLSMRIRALGRMINPKNRG